jgi:hypothetical protein
MEHVCRFGRLETIMSLLSFAPVANIDPRSYEMKHPFWWLLKRGYYEAFHFALAVSNRMYGSSFTIDNNPKDIPLVVQAGELDDNFIPSIKLLLEQGLE